MAATGGAPASAGSAPPPKPWERAPSSITGPSPFRPPSTGSTTNVVEASGTAKPGEVVTTGSATVNANSLTRPVPPRPWEQNYGNSYGYGTGMTYNSGYGSGMMGGYGSSYGGGLYGNNMYRGYGSYGSSMYGGGMYGSGFGGMMGGGYGMGVNGPYGNHDPNAPFDGGPPSPPGFWMSFLRVMQGVVNFFGRVAMLIDQNTQGFPHVHVSTPSGPACYMGNLHGLYFRLLGIRTKSRKQQQIEGPGELAGPAGQQLIEGPKAAAASSGAWDGVWGDNSSNTNWKSLLKRRSRRMYHT